MKVKITPTQQKERLAENLERRVEKVEVEDEEISVETEEPEKLGKVPGVESFKFNGERYEGIKGKPVSKEAYARIESREDAVKALLATIEGYDLRVIDTDREWDLRRLREFNPDIKQLNRPSETLEVEYAISDLEAAEKVDIGLPEDEEVERIYRELLT